MNITITNLEAVNMVEWYIAAQEKLKELPLKLQWTIRKNIKQFDPIHQEFTAFKGELEQKRNAEWFVEGNGKCERTTNENGDEILQITDDFMENFVNYNNEMNKQLNDILLEESSYEISPINIEDVISFADENEIELEIYDIEMMTLFEEKEE